MDDLVAILQVVVAHLGLDAYLLHSILAESLHVSVQIEVSSVSHNDIHPSPVQSAGQIMVYIGISGAAVAAE